MKQRQDPFYGSRYFTGIAYVLFGIPIIVYIWIVLIGRYPIYLGLISAIFSFSLILFIMMKFHRWLKKRTTSSGNDSNKPVEPQ